MGTIYSFLLYSTVLSACESAENAGKCAEAKRRVDSTKPNPKGAQASARLVVLSACQGAENAGKCAEAKRRVDSAKPNPKGAQASARLGVKLAAHPFSPRTARQSRDCLRMRVRYGCTAIFTPSALFPGISRRCTWRSVASVRAQRRPSVARLP